MNLIRIYRFVLARLHAALAKAAAESHRLADWAHNTAESLHLASAEHRAQAEKLTAEAAKVATLIG